MESQPDNIEAPTTAPENVEGEKPGAVTSMEVTEEGMEADEEMHAPESEEAVILELDAEVVCSICAASFSSIAELEDHRQAEHIAGMTHEQLGADGSTHEQQLRADGSTDEQLRADGSTDEQLGADGSTDEQVRADGSTDEQVRADGSTDEQLRADGSTDGVTYVDIVLEDETLVQQEDMSEPRQQESCSCAHCGKEFPDENSAWAHAQHCNDVHVAFSCRACLTLFDALDVVQKHVEKCKVNNDVLGDIINIVEPFQKIGVPAKLKKMSLAKKGGGVILPVVHVKLPRLPMETMSYPDEDEHPDAPGYWLPPMASTLTSKQIANELATLNLRCPLCTERFRDNATFSAHLHKHYVDGGKHRGVKILEAAGRVHPCNSCTELFTDGFSCFQHSLTHVSRKKTPKAPKIIHKCPRCPKFFSSLYQVERHVERVHLMNPTPFQCTECEGRFTSKTALQRHMQIHTDKDWVPGDEVEDDIVIEVTGKKVHHCAICGEELKSQIGVRKHVNKHAPTDNRECFNCPKSFNSFLGFRVHARACITSKCLDCGAHFPSKSQLLQHREVIDSAKYQCHCRKMFCSFRLLKRHRRKHIKAEHTGGRGRPPAGFVRTGKGKPGRGRPLAGSRTHSCKLCARAFSTAWELRAHLKEHQDAPFKCDTCFTGFMSPCEVSRHQIRQHSNGDKTFRCDICNRGFPTVRDLGQHEGESHQYHRPCKCDACGRWMTSPWELLEHQTPFTCTRCGQNQYDGNRLQMHEKLCKAFNPKSVLPQNTTAAAKRMGEVEVINLERPAEPNTDISFECGACAKTFPSWAHLKQHQKEHGQGGNIQAKNGRFECGECEETFPGETTLTQHMKSHVQVQPVQCPECLKVFVNQVSLGLHTPTHKAPRPPAPAVTDLDLQPVADLDLPPDPDEEFLLDSDDPEYKPASKRARGKRTQPPLPKPTPNKSPRQKVHKNPETSFADTPPFFTPREKSLGYRTVVLEIDPDPFDTNPNRPIGPTATYRIPYKRYACEECGQAFTRSHAMRRHVASMHSTERPFQCDACGKTFKLKSEIRRHKGLPACIRRAKKRQEEKEKEARGDVTDSPNAPAQQQNGSDDVTKAVPAASDSATKIHSFVVPAATASGEEEENMEVGDPDPEPTSPIVHRFTVPLATLQQNRKEKPVLLDFSGCPI